MRRLEQSELNDPKVWRAQLGLKASLRLKNPDDPTYPFTEAVGVIQSVGPDDSGRERITLVTRRGEVRIASVADILAAKIF
jgi:hypothetical protein